MSDKRSPEDPAPLKLRSHRRLLPELEITLPSPRRRRAPEPAEPEPVEPPTRFDGDTPAAVGVSPSNRGLGGTDDDVAAPGVGVPDVAVPVDVAEPDAGEFVAVVPSVPVPVPVPEPEPAEDADADADSDSPTVVVAAIVDQLAPEPRVKPDSKRRLRSRRKPEPTAEPGETRQTEPETLQTEPGETLQTEPEATAETDERPQTEPAAQTEPPLARPAWVTSEPEAVSPAEAAPAPAPVVKARKSPLYWRVLRLHHVFPNGWQRALLLEGVIGVALVLVLAGAATIWTLLVLPIVVGVLVKVHDVLMGSVRAGASGSVAPVEDDPRAAEHSARSEEELSRGAGTS
jgi:hypothetical protein